jgi:hypothetical protein
VEWCKVSSERDRKGFESPLEARAKSKRGQRICERRCHAASLHLLRSGGALTNQEQAWTGESEFGLASPVCK